MTELVVSSRDTLAQAIRVVDGKHDLGAAALADALLASGVVQVVPDEETVDSLAGSAEAPPHWDSTEASAWEQGFSSGLRAVLALLEGGSK